MTRIPRETDDSARDIARHATVQSFLNCYYRETGEGEFRAGDDTPVSTTKMVLHCPLDEQGIDLYAPVVHRSPTGRHVFETPVRYRIDTELHACDYLTLATLVTKELDLTSGGDTDRDDLLSRVVSSCRAIERYVEVRRHDDALAGPETTFREAEQSLVFGHLMHPTPKSREGMGRTGSQYAPEVKASFPLHYIRADPAIVAQDSARDGSAAEWVEDALRDDPSVSESFVERHVESDDVLLPLHPWQARYLLEQPETEALVTDGMLASLGQVGREFYPTSSVRTLYAPDSPFMVKGSLAVDITNSERTNKRPELDRGVAISDLLRTELGAELDERFPDFDVIRDPAYLTVETESGDESGFEVVLRENPFHGTTGENTMPVAALCQDGIDGPSHLERVIRDIAHREARDPADVSVDWFRRYLKTAIRPILWLFLEWGVGLEAHQQNGVVTLDDGYPDAFRYRDNQGYYFSEGTYDRVDAVCPGVGERSDTVCPDAVADERIRYYVVLNNAFGVVNAFGTAGTVEEQRLLGLLRDELESLQEFDRPSSSLLGPLLSAETVPCKANLLTRFRGLDELDAPSLDEQSVYADVPNPLVRDFGQEVVR